MDSQHDVMRALRDHARTLGWEIQEWSWKDTDELGSAEYQIWIAPLDATATPTDAACLACPSGCRECSKDESTCECYTHQDDHPDDQGAPTDA